MKKIFIFILLVPILILVPLVAIACSSAQQPPTPTPAPPVPSNGSPLAPTTGEPEPATPLQIEVAIEGSAFNPAILPPPPPTPSSLPPNAPAPAPAPNLPVGVTIVWYNHDSVDHTVTARDNSFDSGRISPNETFEYTFEQSGELEYYCKIHPSMVGKITIEDVNESPSVSHGGLVTDYVSLVDKLRKEGATIEPTGEIIQDFFSVRGQAIKLNGEDVQVFEYSDQTTAEAEAALVSPDGSSIGTSLPFWVAPPHFYRTGSIIVLYVGEDMAVMDVLESVLGAQFAGR